MEQLNLVGILQEMGIIPDTEIPLPYGLSITIGGAENVYDCCRNPNEAEAIDGMLKCFQGAILTLSEIHVIDLCSLVVIIDMNLGVIVSYRDSMLTSIASKLGPMHMSLEDIVPIIFEHIGVINVLNSLNLCPEIKYMEFSELVNLWYQVNQNGLAQQSYNANQANMVTNFLDYNILS